MKTANNFHGVFAAALTPLDTNNSPALEEIPEVLNFLASRGCHGALLLGTTGEGPSFSPDERIAIMESAVRIWETHPEFVLLAGTGTPSLEETIDLTRAAYEIGMNGVVVLPPYYYRKVAEDGLFDWFDQVIKKAVPHGSSLFGYHIPAVSGVPLSGELLTRLLDAHPDRFAGIKNSSADPAFSKELGEKFGEDLHVFAGNDRLFSLALENSASGCITALANLCSPLLRDLWDGFQKNKDTALVQKKLDKGRALIDNNQPVPPLLKFLFSQFYEFPMWPVRPPLTSISLDAADNIITEAKIALEI